MIIDIRDDLADFRNYAKRRVHEYLASDKRLPVYRIDFGFEFGQRNWVALVFDTREDAEPDGTWGQGAIDVLLPRPNWPIWHELPDDEAVYFVDIDGRQVNVMDDTDNLVCKIVGDALKQTLLAARNEGIFGPLPKGQRCELGVENLEGYYGWPIYNDRGNENLVT